MFEKEIYHQKDRAKWQWEEEMFQHRTTFKRNRMRKKENRSH
jgi:hypothetical protein